MKRRVQRILCLTIALLMFAAVFAGCGGEKKAGGNENAAAGANDKPNAGPPVELRVEVFDRGIQGQAPVDNNFWTNWIQENFGKPNNINVTFVPIPRNDETNKLNVWMAANEAPDIVYTYTLDTVNNYVSQGGIKDLGADLDKYGANLKKLLGDEVLKYGVINGKQYTIPAKRPLLGIAASHIRKDWLDKVGLQVPKTTDEFYTAMKAFKEKDPGGLGDKGISYGMSMQAMQYGYYNLLYSFRTKMSEEEYYTLPTWQQPGYKEGVRFVNKMYNEGLISKDFALDKDSKKLMADISNGNVGFFMANVGAWLQPTPGVLPSLTKNNPSAKYVGVDPFTNFEGKRPKLEYHPIGFYMMVPNASKRSAEAVKYLDWMSKSDVLFSLQNGFENEHYTMKDGLPADLKYDGPKKLTFNANTDYTLVINGKEFGSLDKNIKAQSLTCPGFEDLFVETYKQSIADGLRDPYFTKPVVSAAKYNKSLSDKKSEMFAKLYMAKPSEFDKLYDQLVDEYMKMGGQEVMEELRKVYKEMKK